MLTRLTNGRLPPAKSSLCAAAIFAALAIASKEISGVDRRALAERLLEIGYATEALRVLEKAAASSPDDVLLRASARAAVKPVDAVLKLNPDDAWLRLRLARLQTEISGFRSH